MSEKTFKDLDSKVDSLQKEIFKAEKVCTDSNLILSELKQKCMDLQVKSEFLSEKMVEAEAEVASEKSEFEELINSNNEVKDIEKIGLQLEEKLLAETELKDNIYKLLMDKNCKTIDELQSKHIECQNYETKMIVKAEELQKSICSEKEARDNLEFARKKLFEEVSQYTPVYSLEATVKAVDDLKNVISEINDINIKVSSQTEFLGNEMQGKTLQQLNQELDEVREEILKFNNGIIPEKCDDNQIEQLKLLKEKWLEKIQEIKQASIQLSSTIKNQFIGKKNVSEVEMEIHQLKEEILEKDNYYQCLDIAESTVNEAFNEISKSFGPLLNSKTTKIFNSLTDGKYKNVIISRNFAINVQNSESVTSYEWKYLSNGTIDQAYFALRLAVSDLFSKEGTRLPLMLDDVFLQYDEDRATQGLKFLVDYSKKQGINAQIIMFTCQNSIVDLAKKSSDEIIIKSIK